MPEPPAPESEAETPPELEADNPLDRSFASDERKADTGENLKFDFSDERSEHHEIGDDLDETPDEPASAIPARENKRWQVGAAAPEFESVRFRHSHTVDEVPEPPMRSPGSDTRREPRRFKAPPPRFAQPQAPEKSAGFEKGYFGDQSAEVDGGKTYASGYFLAMFLLVAIVFVIASAVISDEPAASTRILSQTPRIGSYFARPIVPAMLVALHDVRTEYRKLKGGNTALLVSGIAQNVGARPLHLVEIDADLIGAGMHPVTSLDVYCGNDLSSKMLGEMTPREIEFSQGLTPRNAFTIEPGGTAPFLMVFMNPPAGAYKIRLSVSKAVAAEATASAAPRGPHS